MIIAGISVPSNIVERFHKTDGGKLAKAISWLIENGYNHSIAEYDNLERYTVPHVYDNTPTEDLLVTVQEFLYLKCLESELRNE